MSSTLVVYRGGIFNIYCKKLLHFFSIISNLKEILVIFICFLYSWMTRRDLYPPAPGSVHLPNETGTYLYKQLPIYTNSYLTIQKTSKLVKTEIQRLGPVLRRTWSEPAVKIVSKYPDPKPCLNVQNYRQISDRLHTYPVYLQMLNYTRKEVV